MSVLFGGKNVSMLFLLRLFEENLNNRIYLVLKVVGFDFDFFF